MRKVLTLLLAFALTSCSIVKQEKAKEEEWRYLYDLGMSSFYAKNYSEAIAYLYRASKVAPQEPRIWNALGIAYMEVGEPRKAEEAFRMALTSDPTFTEAKMNLGILFRSVKDYRRAIRYLEEAISDETFDKKHLAFFHLAKVYKDIGNKEAYIKNLKKATAYNPLFLEAQLELGSAYMDERRYEEAEKLYMSLLANNFKNPEIYLSLARVYYETGRFDKAKEMVRTVLEDKQASNLHRTQAYEILSRILVEEQRRVLERRREVRKRKEAKRNAKRSKVFGIQIAAFSTRERAEKLIEELEKKGLKDLSVIESSGIYKVVYGRFSSRKEAKKEIENLKRFNIYGFIVEVE